MVGALFAVGGLEVFGERGDFGREFCGDGGEAVEFGVEGVKVTLEVEVYSPDLEGVSVVECATGSGGWEGRVEGGEFGVEVGDFGIEVFEAGVEGGDFCVKFGEFIVEAVQLGAESKDQVL